jgi:hypothetical protein
VGLPENSAGARFILLPWCRYGAGSQPSNKQQSGGGRRPAERTLNSCADSPAVNSTMEVAGRQATGLDEFIDPPEQQWLTPADVRLNPSVGFGEDTSGMRNDRYAQSGRASGIAEALWRWAGRRRRQPAGPTRNAGWIVVPGPIRILDRFQSSS